MKKTSLTILLSILTASVVFGQKSIQEEVNAHLKDLPFASFSITVPTFKNKVYNIKDAGAIGDGITKCTEAINSTIKKCSAEGGGMVLVPAGLWLTGPITMASNVNLHLEAGAIVLFSADIEDYPLLYSSSGKASMPSLINGSDLENVAITGKGIFDGNGDHWRPIKKFKKTDKQWKELIKEGEVSTDGKMWFPRKGTQKAIDLKKQLGSKLTKEQWEQVRFTLRSYTLNVEKTKNMLVEGITLMNSPHITNMLREIDGLVMKDVKVLNEWWYQNADGLDISRCKNVLMYDCTVNTGDDGICMKSSLGGKKQDPNTFLLENIVIKDCKVYHGHGAFVIGSNTDGGMRNIYVKNLSCSLTDVGVRFKSDITRGGKVTNIFIEDVFMADIKEAAISFNLTYQDKAAIPADADASQYLVPDFNGISFKNIYCYGAKEAIVIGGVDNTLNVKNVSFENMILQTKKGVEAYASENITFDNVQIMNESGYPFYMKKTKNISFKNIKNVKEGVYAKMLEPETKNITIENSAIKASQVEMLNGAATSELKIK